MSEHSTRPRCDTPAQRRERLQSAYPTWQPRSLAQFFDAAAELYPERPMILCDERAYSYREIIQWSSQLASGLIACGVESGSQVALLLGNFPEFVAVKLAIARIGATAVPINYLLRRHELSYVLEQSESVALITMSGLRDMNYLAELDAILPGWETLAGGTALPRLKRIFVIPTGPLERSGFQTLADLAAAATPQSDVQLLHRQAEVPAHACSDVIYTSGTTGRSKGVMLTHDMVLRTAYASAFTRAFEDGRRILFALPMYHVFGYIECWVAAAFVGGAIIPRVVFDALQMVEAAEQHQASEIVCVPTMTLKMLEVARTRGFDSSRLVAFFNSGGVNPPSIWSDIREVFQAQEILTAYGMSETTASTACTLPEDPEERLLSTNGRLKPAGSAGDPSLGGVLAIYKAVDPETGADVAPGTPGEFLVRGPAVTAGYYKKPDETRGAFVDGWLRTGDVGVIGADGYLALLGRIKESYRCGGEMVIPLEIEEWVNQHSGVAQALVVGVPDPKMGEVGCLCVIANGNGKPDPQDLINLCASHLARFKVPRHVIFIEAGEVPTTATGRPQKFKLAELARQRVGKDTEVRPTAGAPSASAG